MPPALGLSPPHKVTGRQSSTQTVSRGSGTPRQQGTRHSLSCHLGKPRSQAQTQRQVLGQKLPTTGFHEEAMARGAGKAATTRLCALPGPWCCRERPEEQGTVLAPDMLCPLSKPSLPRCSRGSLHPSPRSQLRPRPSGHPQTHRENGSFRRPQPSTMAAAAPACTSLPQLPRHLEDSRSSPLWDLGFRSPSGRTI